MAARPRVLFAWEMGLNFGHISKVAEIARGLGDRAEILFAAKNAAEVRGLLPSTDIPLLPVPLPHRKPGMPPPQPMAASYADAMRFGGWDMPEALEGMVDAWRGLFSVVKPDVLVTQAAPTALLAARGLPFKTVMFGSGYDAPPRANPMPPFLFWDKSRIDPDAIFAREATVLDNANRVLASLGEAPVERFCDILQTDRYLMATFAGIDHYHPRSAFEASPPPYLGQLMTLDKGTPASWLPRAKARVFAYLRPGTRPFQMTMEALFAVDPDIDVIAAIPGAPAEVIARAKSTAVRIIPSGVRLAPLLPDCDLGVSHGSNGMAAAFVLHGIPQIAVPTQTEQLMCARAFALQGLGRGFAGAWSPPQLSAAVAEMVADSALQSRCAAAKGALSGSSVAKTRAAIADQILELVA